MMRKRSLVPRTIWWQGRGTGKLGRFSTSQCFHKNPKTCSTNNAALDALQADVDALERSQTETAAELDDLPDRASRERL